MSYKALYNKYRPTTFKEVAGQDAIVKTLKNAIAMDKIAHAYLFCGPRGTGKTTMARLFAKALNCEEGVGHQCNHCDNCISINEGSHPDVIEIDAASNSGVDQVRDLIEQVRYSPIKGRYKVYIIDEVHVMSTSAFNALLKTLEEPPDHVVFILATTEPYKILPTILSRCQRYDFGKIPDKDIKRRLIEILEKEDVDYEEEGLDGIVSLADGGMRDALSILDQIIAYGGNNLKEEDVLAVFGLISTSEKINLLKLIGEGDVAAVLTKLDDFINAGIDLQRLSDDLLDILKDLLVYEKTQSSRFLVKLNDETVSKLSTYIKGEITNQFIDILLKQETEFKSVSSIRALFELTMLQMCSLTKPSKVEPKQVEQPKPSLPKEEPEITPSKESPSEEQAEEELAYPVDEPSKYSPESGQKYEGTTAPDFLFDGEDNQQIEEPLEDSSSKQEEKTQEKVDSFIPKEESKAETSLTSHLVDEGDELKLDDDTLIGVMVLGTSFRSQRQSLYDRWNEFEGLKFDQTLGEAATLLSSAKPLCLCQDVILLTYTFDKQANKNNLAENQNLLQDAISRILGRKVFIYGLDLKEKARITKIFTDKQQINTLPNADQIVLNIPKGE